MSTASQPVVRSCNLADMLSRAGHYVLIVAHRGLWGEQPENSIGAILAAGPAGADMVELDVRTTADGACVIMHDPTIDRTTNGSGAVADLPLGAIRSARLKVADGGDGASLTDQQVPTLAEALEAARNRIAVNLDTQPGSDIDAIAEIVLDMRMADQVLLKTSVDVDADPLGVTRRSFFGKVPHMPMMPVRSGEFANDLRMITALNAPMVEIKFSSLDDIVAARAELERQNLRVWSNSLDVVHSLDLYDSRAKTDPDAVWGQLIAAGVGAIQTDLIVDLHRYLAVSGLARE